MPAILSMSRPPIAGAARREVGVGPDRAAGITREEASEAPRIALLRRWGRNKAAETHSIGLQELYHAPDRGAAQPQQLRCAARDRSRSTLPEEGSTAPPEVTEVRRRPKG